MDPKTVKTAVDLAKYAGLIISHIKPDKQSVRRLTYTIAKERLQLEGEALSFYTKLISDYLSGMNATIEDLNDILGNAFKESDERTIIYITQLIKSVSLSDIPKEKRGDIIQEIIKRKLEIEKLEKEEKSKTTRTALVAGGVLLATALAIIGYRYARPMTFTEWLDKII